MCVRERERERETERDPFAADGAQSQTQFDIGFGELTESAPESVASAMSVSVSLRPSSISANVTGRLVPLTYDQWRNYSVENPRTIPDEVQQELDRIAANVLDTAERKLLFP